MERTLKDLNPNPKNPRIITDDKLAQLEKSIRKLGPLDGFVFNVRFQRLIGAHQRQKVMPPEAQVVVQVRYEVPSETGTVASGYVDWLGERHPYREVDVDEQTEKAMNLAANKGGGDWDAGVVGEWMKELKQDGFDLGLTMFDEKEQERAMFDGWGSTSGQVEKTEANLNGIDAIIRVTCPVQMLGEVKRYLKEKIEETGFEGVQVVE